MITVTKQFEFAAAHRLMYHKGLCKNLHGHNYILEITVRNVKCNMLNAENMVIDFADLKAIVKKHVIDKLDHSYLNDTYDNPTAEHMVFDIANIIHQELPPEIEIYEAKLWETSNSYAMWRRDA